MQAAEFLIGTVSDVSSDGVKILFDGQTEATEKRYKQINTGVQLAEDDRIVVMKISGSYVVMGKISYAGSGGGGAPEVIAAETAFAIPAAGSSTVKDMTGITSAHVLLLWNFSVSPENVPPADLQWSTASGSFTITNNSGTTSETIQPVFALPTAVAVSNH